MNRCIITSELANQRAPKAQFTREVCTKSYYAVICSGTWPANVNKASCVGNRGSPITSLPFRNQPSHFANNRKFLDLTLKTNYTRQKCETKKLTQELKIHLIHCKNGIWPNLQRYLHGKKIALWNIHFQLIQMHFFFTSKILADIFA